MYGHSTQSYAQQKRIIGAENGWWEESGIVKNNGAMISGQIFQSDFQRPVAKLLLYQSSIHKNIACWLARPKLTPSRRAHPATVPSSPALSATRDWLSRHLPSFHWNSSAEGFDRVREHA
jgi:hypothetical protein